LLAYRTTDGAPPRVADHGRRRRARGERGGGGESIVAEINITPLTDIFLVLLIIFMVTSTAMVESESAQRAGVKVSLPRANAAGR